MDEPSNPSWSPVQVTCTLPSPTRPTSPCQLASSLESPSTSSITFNPIHQEVIAAGGHDLPFPGKFLEMSELILKLQNVDANPHPRVPMGLKENQYFFIENEANLERRRKKQNCIWWDDCGAWVSGASNKTFVIQSGEIYQEVIHKDGVYGINQRKSVKRVRMATFVPLINQPSNTDIIEIHRSYAKHTYSEQYKRRISWMVQPGKELPPIAIAEYVGKFPGLTAHGNSKSKKSVYVRMPPEALAKIKEDVHTQLPKQVYLDNLHDSSDIISLPRDYKQVENARYREKKKKKEIETLDSTHSTFADYVQSIQTMIASHSSAKGKKKTPTVIICYPQESSTDEESDDITPERNGRKPKQVKRKRASKTRSVPAS